MLDALVDRQQRQVAGAGQAPVIEQGLHAAQHARLERFLRHHPVDVVSAGELEQGTIEPSFPSLNTGMIAPRHCTTMAASAGKRRHILDRIPSGLLGAMAGVFLGQMIGPSLQQKFTTCAELGEVAVLEVKRRQVGRRVLHWVRIDHESMPVSS